MIGRQRWALVLPFLVVSGYALCADTRWVGGWAGTVDRTTGTTVLTGPVLASIAAGLQLGVTRLRPIGDTTPRGWVVPYRSAGEAWAMGTVGYLLTAVAAVVCTLAVPHGGPAQWWALAAGAGVLALAALFGALCAHLLPHPVTVVAAGPVLFLLGAFGPAPLPEVLRFGPTGSMTGLQLVPSVHAARVGALVALCLCLAVAAGPWRRRPRPGALISAAVVAGALAVAGGAAVVHTGTGIGDNRLEPSGERATACAGSAPAVCVAPSDRRFLGAVERSFERPAAVLAEAGVVLPDRYVARLPYVDAAEGTGEFSFDERRGELPFPQSVLLLTHPAACPQWAGDAPPFVALDAEQVIAEWASARAGGTATAISPDMERWLPHVDDPATTRWVVETFAHLTSCDFESIAMPWERR